MMDTEQPWKRYRIRRDGQPDLAFQGQRLAAITYSDGYDRLYITRSGKLVLGTRDVNEETDEETYSAELFESMDQFVTAFNERFGPYSQRLKALLSQAAEVDSSLRKFYVEEI